MTLKPLTTPRYDLATLPLRRILAQELEVRCIPLGHFGGGANLKFILRLIGLHYLEGIRQALKIRLESVLIRKGSR